MAARTMTTLDHLTDGRVGLNVVTVPPGPHSSTVTTRRWQKNGWNPVWRCGTQDGAVLIDQETPRHLRSRRRSARCVGHRGHPRRVGVRRFTGHRCGQDGRGDGRRRWGRVPALAGRHRNTAAGLTQARIDSGRSQPQHVPRNLLGF
ncbi:hypothetical protein [Mycolicibacterium mengxianglii]|uniref:hypothetical protein n=1 Tax=Mycolicibacterium mengxianglii TaxID=2736649 RepID=UPI001E457CB2|nr:hypothetical protein [Mycolicibacterium mengxianglii]